MWCPAAAAEWVKDGGRGLIERSNWSSCVISTSVTPASGSVCFPEDFREAGNLGRAPAVDV